MLPSFFQENVFLASQTSWMVGGSADLYAEPISINELREAYLYCVKNQIPTTVIAGGTNVLISDKGIRGATLSLRKLSGISELKTGEHLQFWALAGTPKSELLKIFLKH